MIYDVIGDVHGQIDKLTGLLDKLGYRFDGTSFIPPPNHQAVFIGDLIDRGPAQLATLELVFSMIDEGNAKAVMGNHEYNALAYATTNGDTHLRPHTKVHQRQHVAFLAELPFGSSAHQYWLKRFYELPLWLETKHACFVHACWDEASMAVLAPLLKDGQLTKKTLPLTADPKHSAHMALERLLKGIEAALPNGMVLTDKDGAKRTRIRVAWWLPNLQTGRPRLHDVARAPKEVLAKLPMDACIDPVSFTLSTKKPVFVGHYWLTGRPKPLSPQVVCTDYSAAGRGPLTAYRFDSASPWPLKAENFVQFLP